MVKGVKWLKHCGGEGRFSLGCCLTCFAALLLYLFFVARRTRGGGRNCAGVWPLS